MTKKDYELIALLIRESDQFKSEAGRLKFAMEIARSLKADNARFSREIFLKACKPRWVVGASGQKESRWDREIERARCFDSSWSKRHNPEVRQAVAIGK